MTIDYRQALSVVLSCKDVAIQFEKNHLQDHFQPGKFEQICQLCLKKID